MGHLQLFVFFVFFTAVESVDTLSFTFIGPGSQVHTEPQKVTKSKWVDGCEIYVHVQLVVGPKDAPIGMGRAASLNGAIHL